MQTTRRLDFQALLDGVTQAVLVFDAENQLVHANAAADAMFGGDLKLLKGGGWPAAAVLFSTRSGEGQTLDDARAQALETGLAVPFHTLRAGEYVAARLSAVRDRHNNVYTLLMVDSPDWTALTELLDRFLNETRDAVDTTRGHADLIEQVMRRAKPGDSVEKLASRIGGFTHLISIHMLRTQRLLALMARLQDIRLGTVRQKIAGSVRPIHLDEFIEDFAEGLSHSALLDPETAPQDVRDRLILDVPSGLVVEAAPGYLADILRDILRNAMMYSDQATPVEIVAREAGNGVQISVIDQGYGVRASESERVTLPFARARQPQVIAEFGYGLSLFLCKHEVEAMHGRIWYESEEGAGTAFHVKLPAWQDAAPSSSDH